MTRARVDQALADETGDPPIFAQLRADFYGHRDERPARPSPRRNRRKVQPTDGPAPSHSREDGTE